MSNVWEDQNLTWKMEFLDDKMEFLIDVLQILRPYWQWIFGTLVLGVCSILYMRSQNLIAREQLIISKKELELSQAMEDREKTITQKKLGPDILIGMSNGHLDGLLNIGPIFLNQGKSNAVIESYFIDEQDLSDQVRGLVIYSKRPFEEKPRFTKRGKTIIDLYGEEVIKKLVELIEPKNSFNVTIIFRAPEIEQKFKQVQKIKLNPETKHWERSGDGEVTTLDNKGLK